MIFSKNAIRFNTLLLSRKLWTYLADLNEQATARMDLIIRHQLSPIQKELLDQLTNTIYSANLIKF